MVPNLPYFMVQWDYKGKAWELSRLILSRANAHLVGEKGYGHVIEGVDGPEGGGDGYDVDEGDKGGGDFPRFVT